nr:MAG TPA: hypothetical protein [Caudoviricetes sp.]
MSSIRSITFTPPFSLPPPLTASQRISFSLFTLLKLQLSLTSIFKSAKLSVLIRCTKGPGSLLPGLFLCHSTMHS